MIKLSSYALATAVAAFLLAAPASAQTAAPAAAPATKMAPTAKAAPAAKAKPERTAASLECSKQADAKGLHGKERKKFRSECKKGGAKAN